MKILITCIAIFIISNECSAQKLAEIKMNIIEYEHNESPSFQSKLIQATMGLFGMKNKIEKKMISNNFVKNPATPPKSMKKNFNVLEVEQNGRKVWTISPKEDKADVIILYLHGGAYMGNLSKQHWDLIEQLVTKTNTTMIVPDYPLVPKSNCTETYDFIGILYAKLLIDYPTKRIILVGDSAGGGLALGFAQQLRNQNRKQPNQLIILSPWLDVTMNNPGLNLIDKGDKMLSIRGLKSAGQKYAGNLDLKDYKVSPIYGDLTGLCKMSIFTGTYDILNADAQKCRQLLKDQQIKHNYFEYPKMFHDWVIITSLKESQDVITKVARLVNNY